MKHKIPEAYQARFQTLLRSLPLDLQENAAFQEALWVHLKLGGMTLARHLAETTVRFHNVDVLEIGSGLRFPKVVDTKSEETENAADADDPDDADNGDDDVADGGDNADNGDNGDDD